MSTYILVHGGWHTGAELDATAAPLREAGHNVHLPTLAGNRPGDSKGTGLEEAITSLLDYIEVQALTDAQIKLVDAALETKQAEIMMV